MEKPTVVEICAGAGGQALGLEEAGFDHLALVEIDKTACATLRLNRPHWTVVESDVSKFDGRPFKGRVDLLAGGVPCPPFSVAGKKLGRHDERDLFPEALRLAEEILPSAVMLENVKGLLEEGFAEYRKWLRRSFQELGYRGDWRLLNASDFGVSQLRPRAIFIAFRAEMLDGFIWPTASGINPKPVGEVLCDLIAANGWKGAKAWRKRANEIAPTIVGGSTKHGGPDLGPTRAKRAWAALGVDAHGVVDKAPAWDFVGMPRLTVSMVARLQGFPDSWIFVGRKTNTYRQVGNAFPPPVARAVGLQVAKHLISAAGARVRFGYERGS